MAKIKKLVNTLILCQYPQNRDTILEAFGLSNIFKNYKSHILILVDNGLLERTIPGKPTSPNQKYKTTEKGIKLFDLIKGLI